MLFNSYEFIFGFLPITFGLFLALSAAGWRRFAAAWLMLASLVFYGYWAPQYLLLLCGSIGANYLVGRTISERKNRGADKACFRLLLMAVTGNLLVLGYFKYANFMLGAVGSLAGTSLPVLDVVLPIGISFFTFTQIAFLVDCFEGKVKEQDPINYALFVSYFPHLIAGPVLHHAEMMPQFAERKTYRFCAENFAIGTTFFVIGLFKKVVLADGIQPYVGPIFDGGGSPHFFAAWGGALAYTLQLYFDFSAYSDMAIGLSKIFNVDLPLNFNSPYKSRNISDFWRRWHMTLSRFLRDYLYIRMGGNRGGKTRRYVNLMVTMLLGGLWHGAGWTFVIWGGLHGFYLVINHAWAALRRGALSAIPDFGVLGRASSVLLTFLAVVVAWVFFRATSFEAAVRVLRGMSGANGLLVPSELWLAPLLSLGFEASGAASIDWRQIGWIVSLLGIAWGFPNSQEWVGRCLVGRSGDGVAARPYGRWFAIGASVPLLLLLTVINGSRGVSEFIYFNF